MTATTASPNELDPITVEVLRHAFAAAADEMKINLMRTAFNPLIYEVLDFSVGIFDRRARMIAQADGLPIFLGNLGIAVQRVVDDIGLDAFRPGDIYLFNDPYLQGNHVNDVTTVQPVFDAEGQVAAFAVTRAHWLDIGGKNPGGAIDSTDVVQEGLWFRSVPLYEAGVPNTGVWRIIEYNVRYQRNMLGDLRAQVAASHTGDHRLRALLERYGRTGFDSAVQTIISQAETRARAAIAAMPDGTYEAAGQLDDDCLGHGPLDVCVRATIAGDRLTLDLEGSAPQNVGPVNCGLPATLSAARLVLKALTTPDQPANDGDFAPLELIVPDDSMFNAQYPAPTFMYGTHLILLADVILRALAAAAPGRAIAGHYGNLSGFQIDGIDPASGQLYIQQEPEVGGWGAHAGGDGENALIFLCDGDARNISSEIVEARFPLRMERHALRPDSGGAGQHRGGLGILRDYRVLGHEARCMAIMDRKVCPPWGIAGGEDAQHCQVVVNPPGEAPEVHQKIMGHPLADGAVVSVQTGGGGGWGDPHRRPADAVREDVLAGYVSVESARADYGVAIDPVTSEIDHETTRRLRGDAAGAETSRTH
jgi:N-methylhydantoinase B